VSINADEIIDRRRLRKKISFWRIATFVILGIALLSMIGFGINKAGLSSASTDHIARVKITGVITNDEPMLKLLKKLKDDAKVKAVILNISSPGGSTVFNRRSLSICRRIRIVRQGWRESKSNQIFSLKSRA